MRQAVRYIFFCQHSYRQRQKKDTATILYAKHNTKQKTAWKK